MYSPGEDEALEGEIIRGVAWFNLCFKRNTLAIGEEQWGLGLGRKYRTQVR